MRRGRLDAEGEWVSETSTCARATRSTRRWRLDADVSWDEAFRTRGVSPARTFGLCTSGEEP